MKWGIEPEISEVSDYKDECQVKDGVTKGVELLVSGPFAGGYQNVEAAVLCPGEQV